ncbi:YhgE/Pip domain-containing protein [Aciduricibacillus chroicocephali]|uniref:YhgE/Pip domain-containing protein n=1 Tax=Aciduricibacillus chroicocephali TaxID=3054939 RepID=A0ABY9KXD2_9BACI|nr:YhgE/Pip domain-containing protein [Bacillaceae bacterium 44XB]
MKNIGRIYGRDMKNIATNWVVLVLISGLVILPSLYAWFNIKASWDPYGQTEHIPIGVVNADKGATVRGEKIHGGDEIVKALKANKSMGWKFTDRKTAMEKVKYGDYFAVIVIPEDFSKNLGSVLDEKPTKGKIEYYVNEKLNAIAPKITSKGASVIVDQVSSKFIGTANGAIFDVFNSLGVELKKDKPDIERFENYIFKIEKDLPEIHKMLSGATNDAANANELVRNAKGQIPKAKETVQNGLEITDDAMSYLNKAEAQLNEISPNVKKDLKTAKDITDKTNSSIKEARNMQFDFSKGQELATQLNKDANASLKKIGEIENAIANLEAQADKIGQAAGTTTDEEGNEKPNADIEEQVKKQKQVLQDAKDRLETLKGAIGETQDNATKVRSFAEDKKKEVDRTLKQLQDKTAATSVQIDAFLKEYENNIEPTVLAQISKTRDTLQSAREMLSDVKDAIPAVEKILNNTEANLNTGSDKLNDVMGQYPYVSEKIRQVADRIRSIQGETDLNDIIQLLLNNPEAEKGFFEQPVKLDEHKLYPIENYGTGMTPFYTTLAIWVGCLLLISLVVAEVHSEERKFTKTEEYFGRGLTFLTIGLIQSLIVTLGDIFIINVHIHNPVWFVIFGLFIGLIFMMMVYTLVSIFGNVGKAMAIIALVLQVAGSGGTYPVVLLPTFFQKINPFLPFTYGVDLLREAVGGIVWERVQHDVMMLAVFGILFLILGVLLKEPINKNTDKIQEKARESGLFH